MKSNIGVLVTNVGTPDNPTPKAVRRYLKEFLLDPHIVRLPRWLWIPILYGIILPFRAPKSAKLYQKIWTAEGSPLLSLSQKIVSKLRDTLHLPIELGMHYGQPSIKDAIQRLQQQGVNELIVLPLFPQYSSTTTESTQDFVKKYWPSNLKHHLITSYADNPEYISTLCDSVHKCATQSHLLFSFHGIPKQFISAGDPYADQCYSTVKLLVKQLDLTDDTWSLAFQSRLGKAEWLTPYTESVLAELPKRGITHLQVMCPGFAVDCLETLEEIAIRGKEVFLENGGKTFEYIPALNHSDQHIKMLANLIKPFIKK